MKPIEFDYLAPEVVDEALTALETTKGAVVLAGGQSLVPLLNLRLVRPTLVVDINRIRGLDRIRETSGGIAIGATVRQGDATLSALVASHVPLIQSALTFIGHPQVRNRGTIVGSLVHHDPAAELPAVAVAMGALITVQGPRGRRVVSADRFFLSSYKTEVAEDELATEVWFPTSPRSSGAAYEQVSRRHGDFALVGVAAQITVQAQQITHAAVAFSSMADRPIRAQGVENLLLGQPPVAEVFREAAAWAPYEAGVMPKSDIHASATYRRETLPVLVRRALAKAVANASTRPDLDLQESDEADAPEANH